MLTCVLFYSSQAFTTDRNYSGPGTDAVSSRVQAAMLTEFKSASDVSWTVNEGLYFAKFLMNATNYTSAFNKQGEMLAVYRTIPIASVPLAVAKALQSKYSSYSLPLQVTEMVMYGTTSYYLYATGKKAVYQLCCTADGAISVHKKIKKD